MYLKDSPICKGEVGALVWGEYLQSVFDGLNRGMSNFFETTSLITSSSASRVKCIGLYVIVSSSFAYGGKGKVTCGISLNLFHSLEKSRKLSKASLDL